MLDSPVLAEVLYQRMRPALVVGCFSTALLTAATFYDLPTARTGTGLLLERLTPYQNSNRVPVTLVDALVPDLADRGERPRAAAAPAAIAGLVATVGYAMQHQIYPQLRPEAERYLDRPPRPADLALLQAAPADVAGAARRGPRPAVVHSAQCHRPQGRAPCAGRPAASEEAGRVRMSCPADGPRARRPRSGSRRRGGRRHGGPGARPLAAARPRRAAAARRPDGRRVPLRGTQRRDIAGLGRLAGSAIPDRLGPVRVRLPGRADLLRDQRLRDLPQRLGAHPARLPRLPHLPPLPGLLGGGPPGHRRLRAAVGRLRGARAQRGADQPDHAAAAAGRGPGAGRVLDALGRDAVLRALRALRRPAGRHPRPGRALLRRLDAGGRAGAGRPPAVPRRRPDAGVRAVLHRRRRACTCCTAMAPATRSPGR